MTNMVYISRYTDFIYSFIISRLRFDDLIDTMVRKDSSTCIYIRVFHKPTSSCTVRMVKFCSRERYTMAMQIEKLKFNYCFAMLTVFFFLETLEMERKAVQSVCARYVYST